MHRYSRILVPGICGVLVPSNWLLVACGALVHDGGLLVCGVLVPSNRLLVACGALVHDGGGCWFAVCWYLVTGYW